MPSNFDEQLGELLSGLGLRRDALWMMDLETIQQWALSRASAAKLPLGARSKESYLAGDYNGTGVHVVNVSGVFMPRAEWSDEIDSTVLANVLRSLITNDQVKAVVLNIDSPGGAVQGMTSLHAAASELADAKPLYVHAEYTCCSGAFYLASPASKIFAGPDANVGSIGVRTMLFDWSKWFEDKGIKAIAIDTGQFKSLGAAGLEVTEAQQTYLRERVDALFESFTAAVMSGRGMSAEQFAAVSEGQVFLAQRALELGLIDGVQSLAATISAAAAAASPSTLRSTTMADATTPAAVSLTELKRTFPNSTAEWREEQVENEATMSEAAVAYAKFQEEQAKQAREQAEAEAKRADEAEAKAAEQAEKAQAEPKKKGHSQASASGDPDAETVEGEGPDYRAMAFAYMEKHNCRWSEACLEIKRRHPESQGAFGVPPR